MFPCDVVNRVIIPSGVAVCGSMGALKQVVSHGGSVGSSPNVGRDVGCDLLVIVV